MKIHRRTKSRRTKRKLRMKVMAQRRKPGNLRMRMILRTMTMRIFRMIPVRSLPMNRMTRNMTPIPRGKAKIALRIEDPMPQSPRRKNTMMSHRRILLRKQGNRSLTLMIFPILLLMQRTLRPMRIPIPLQRTLWRPIRPQKTLT